MNRREMLRGSVAGMVASGMAWPARGAKLGPSHGDTERWGVFELELKGPSAGNPYMDVELHAEFRLGNRVVPEVLGSYDGNGIYRVRFMPDELGEWSYRTVSGRGELNGLEGHFRCVKPGDGNHGPVMVRDTWHFCHADGTPYHPFGTTCYAWVHQTQALQEQTLLFRRLS